MTKRRFGKRLAWVRSLRRRSPRRVLGADGRTRAEGSQADQFRRCAVRRTQRHAHARRQEGQARRDLSAHQRAAPVAAAERLCNLETGPETFQIVTTSDAQAAQLKGLSARKSRCRVDEVACAQDAGQMSEAVVTKWSVVTEALIPPGALTPSLQAFRGPSVAKCPRRCSQASRIRLGTATTTQIAKNSGQPVAFAT